MASRKSARISALESANKGYSIYCPNCEQQGHNEKECSLPPLEVPTSKEELPEAEWNETTMAPKRASRDSAETNSALRSTSFEKFNDLPVELELMIWTFAALDYGRKQTYRLHNNCCNPLEHIPNPLLRACKQSRYETLRTFNRRNIPKHCIFVHVPTAFKDHLLLKLPAPDRRIWATPGDLHSGFWNEKCWGCMQNSRVPRFGRVQIKAMREGRTITESIMVLSRHKTECRHFKGMESDLKTLVAGHLSSFYGSNEGEGWTILKRTAWMAEHQAGARIWSNKGNYHSTWLREV